MGLKITASDMCMAAIAREVRAEIAKGAYIYLESPVGKRRRITGIRVSRNGITKVHVLATGAWITAPAGARLVGVEGNPRTTMQS